MKKKIDQQRQFHKNILLWLWQAWWFGRAEQRLFIIENPWIITYARNILHGNEEKVKTYCVITFHRLPLACSLVLYYWVCFAMWAMNGLRHSLNLMKTSGIRCLLAEQKHWFIVHNWNYVLLLYHAFNWILIISNKIGNKHIYLILFSFNINSKLIQSRLTDWIMW